MLKNETDGLNQVVKIARTWKWQISRVTNNVTFWRK